MDQVQHLEVRTHQIILISSLTRTAFIVEQPMDQEKVLNWDCITMAELPRWASIKTIVPLIHLGFNGN